jgi:hypothetical protein
LTVANTALLRQNLLGTLISPAAKKIDFWVETIHVDITAFIEVFANIFNGKIDVVIEALPGRETNAIYNRKRDTFLFRAYDFGTTPDQQAVMIHESVHAFTDIRNMYWNKYFVDEVAGNIAEALFFQYLTGKTTRQFVSELARELGDPTMKLEPHEEMACDIAIGIAGTPGASVSFKDIDRLSRVIHNHPDYRNIDLDAFAGANGV